MAQILDLVPWPKDGHNICAIPAVLLPVEPRTSRLAGVKDRLYHPALPTLRQMDMDTAMNKLPDEHSQTATACTKGNVSTELWKAAGQSWGGENTGLGCRRQGLSFRLC